MAQGNKALQIGFAVAGMIAVLAATIYLAVYVANRQGHSDAEACTGGSGAAHPVTIQRNVVTPWHTTGKLCDTLTITNQDETVRLLAFGVHEDHQTYDGVGEKTLSKGQSLTITLVKAGDFTFHDHIHDKVTGTFTVTE